MKHNFSYLHQLKLLITPSVFCTNNLMLQPKSCEPGGFSIVPFVVKINMDEILSSEKKYCDKISFSQCLHKTISNRIDGAYSFTVTSPCKSWF